MAVGLTVDYVIHISFAITDAINFGDKDKSIKSSFEFDKILSISMKSMGLSVLKGAFTSLLGGLPLLLTSSQGFRIFGVMWIAIIVIAVLHGFLFVPSVLYEVFSFYRWYKYPSNKIPKQNEQRVDGNAIWLETLHR